MALTVTARGTGTHNTGATTLVPGGRNATLPARSTGVFAIAVDNAGTGGANTICPATWTDAKGNVWTRRQNALYDNGAASAGIEMAFYTAAIEVALLTTDLGTITWDGGASPVAKAWTWYQLDGAANTDVLYETGGTIAGATAANAQVTTASVPVGDAVIAGYFSENVGAVTGDSDSTNGSWGAQQTATVGSGTSGVRIATQHKVQTTTPSTQSYDVTVASQDRIAGYIMLHEGRAAEASVVATGGGAAVAPATTDRIRSETDTGGGVLTVVETTARNASPVATGGGVATVVVETVRALPINDTFTASDGTLLSAHQGNSGQRYDTDTAGSMDIQSNRAHPVTAGARAVVTGVTGSSEILLSAVVNFGSDGVTRGWSLRLRRQDHDNFLHVNVRRSTTPACHIELWERVATVETRLVQNFLGADFFAANTDYDLLVIAVGDRIRGYIDGVERLNTTTTRFQTQTSFGFAHVEAGIGTNQSLDDFTAADVPNADASPIATGGGVVTVDATAGAGGENHDASPTMTGGGVAAATATTNRPGSPVLTGGGVVAANGTTNRPSSPVATGGGVASVAAAPAKAVSVAATGGGAVTPSIASARAAAAAMSGGGVLAAVPATQRFGAPISTGGGVAVIDGTQAENHDATFSVTGGGSVAVTTVAGRTGSPVATGGGVATTSIATQRLAELIATGGGRVTVTSGNVIVPPLPAKTNVSVAISYGAVGLTITGPGPIEVET